MEGILNVLLPSILIVFIIHLLKLVSLLRFILLVNLAITSTFFVDVLYCEVLKYSCPSDPLIGLGYFIHSILVVAVSFVLEIARTNLLIHLKRKYS
ncbi:MAG: hypothetical protein ACI9YH_003494 [Colwellia sp.]|jgi:hypothetical protein